MPRRYAKPIGPRKGEGDPFAIPDLATLPPKPKKKRKVKVKARKGPPAPGQSQPGPFPAKSPAPTKAKRTRASQRRVRAILRTTTSKPQGAAKATKPPRRTYKPPTAKPVTFQGKPTAGTPTLRSLRVAQRTGKLRVNAAGFVTTPKVRRVSRELKRAKRAAPKAKRDVGGIEDPQIRKAIVRHAPKVEKLAKQSYGLSGEALLSKLVEGESGESQSAVSSASAKSITQFIPSTRDDFVNRLGVDPWKNKNSAVKAATMHLDGKHGYSPGLEGYNPGGGQSYVDYILDQPVGGPVRTGKRTTPRLRRATKEAQALGLRVAQPKGKVPKKVLTRFKAAKQAARELEKAKLPYVWGGGHGDPASRPTGGGLDCSGAVSYVLNKMGAMRGSLVSGDMGAVLKPGPGAVTVFYNPGHTFMKIGNRYFGTSRTNPAGGPGFIDTPDLSGYKVGHVPGMGKRVAMAMGVPLTGGGSFPGMTLSASGTSATISSGATKGNPGFSSKPITPLQRGRRKLKGLAELGVGVGGGPEEHEDTILKELEEKYGAGVI